MIFKAIFSMAKSQMLPANVFNLDEHSLSSSVFMLLIWMANICFLSSFKICENWCFKVCDFPIYCFDHWKWGGTLYSSVFEFFSGTKINHRTGLSDISCFVSRDLNDIKNFQCREKLKWNFWFFVNFRASKASKQADFVFQSKAFTINNHCNGWSDISY